LYHFFQSIGKRSADLKLLKYQLVIPKSLRLPLLDLIHISSNHPGTQSLFLRFREAYYFPKYFDFIKAYTDSCDICQRIKRVIHPIKTELKPINYGSEFLSSFGIDLATCLPVSKNGNNTILVVVEHVTRMTWVFAIPDEKGSTIAEKLYSLFCFVGFPRYLTSDRGANFLGAILTSLYDILGIKRIKTAAFRPQSNSYVERKNSLIWTAFKALIKDQSTWDEKLETCLLGIRAAHISSIGCSSFKAFFGQEIRLPGETAFLPRPSSKNKSAEHFLEKMEPRLHMLRDICTKNNEAAQQRSKTAYDKNANPTELSEGMKVLLHNPSIRKAGQFHKFTQFWQGPYRIMHKISPHNVILMNLKDFKVSNVPVNVNRLRIYNDSRHLLEFESPEQQGETVTPDAPTEVNDHFTAEPPLGTVVTPVTVPVTNNYCSPTQTVQLRKRGRPRKQIIKLNRLLF